MEILAVDHCVERLVAASLNLAHADKAGIDVILELRGDDQVIDAHRLRFGFRAIERFQPGPLAAPRRLKPRHLPKPVVAFRCRPSRRKDANFVALSD